MITKLVIYRLMLPHYPAFLVLDAPDAPCQTPSMQVDFTFPVPFDTAVALLSAGDVCAFPTETVYGLGADATSSDAVLKIYETKRRPRFNPLIVHCADLDMARSLGDFSPTAELLTKFWPGPLTLVLPRRTVASLSDLVTAGLSSIGVRIPAHPLTRKLIAAVGKPLAAPSANPSGHISPTTATQVQNLFGGKVPVLDGGPCTTGLESTILAVQGNEVRQLRAGGLARNDVEELLGKAVRIAEADDAITAPGMMKSHYAPRAMLRLNASAPHDDEAYLGFGDMPKTEVPSRNLSSTGDLNEAAQNLFACLHELDSTNATTIAVAPVPEHGLGEAINDRLRRAAAPRT